MPVNKDKTKHADNKKKSKWSEIFADGDSYSDDLQIILKDKDGNEQTHTLGALREYNEEHEGALLQNLEERETAVKNEKTNVDKATNELLEMVKKATGGSLDLSDLGKKAAAGKRVTREDVTEVVEGLDESDPIVGSLVKQLNSVKGDHETKLNAIAGTLDKFKQVMGTMLNTYLDDNYQGQYARLSQEQISRLPEKTRKKYGYDLLKKHATDNGFKDKNGRLDLNRAFRDMAFDDLTEVEAETRSTKKIEERDTAQRMASISKPGRPGDNRAKATIDVAKSADPLGDAFEAAMNDTEMWGDLMKQGAA